MSYKLTQAVIDTIGVPLVQKAVLLVLARHARDDGTNSKCPSVQTIADKAGMSDKCARNALRALETEGWIAAIGDKSGGRSKATSYSIVIGRLEPPETRHDVPPKETKTRHHVPPIDPHTRNDVPSYPAETRNDVPLNPERRSAEYVNEEKKESYSVDSCQPPASAREVGRRVETVTTIPLTDKNLAVVRGWLKRGDDPDLDILPAIENTLNTTRFPVDQIRKFGFFTDDIETWRLRRLNPIPGRPRLSVVQSSGKPMPKATSDLLELKRRYTGGQL
jgi:hypothetical protein